MKIFARRYLLGALCLSALLFGCGSKSSVTTPPATQAAPILTSIAPSSASAGSVGLTVTVTGSNFVPGSEITWNGTERATLYQSATSLQMVLTAADLANASSIPVGVTDPVDVGGASSANVFFTISPDLTPNPLPVLTALNPSSAQAGSPATTITLSGSNFLANSIVFWNGQALTTSFQSSSSLTVQLPASDLITAGSAAVTVSNPAPGGGTSGSIAFTIEAVGTGSTTLVNVPANDLAWDSVNQLIYLSLPSSVGANGNSVQSLNPVTGVLGTSAFAGSEPDLLSVSATSKYLYVTLDGSSSLQRFLLPSLTKDINISFGAASFYGPYVAMDVQASPAADGTVSTVLGTPGVSPEEEGGVQIYDDATVRPNVLCGFIQFNCSGSGGELFDSIQWNTSATEMYALNNEDTGFDFYSVPVTTAGFSTVTDYGALAGGFGDAIHFDQTTNLVYTDYGNVIDPASGEKIGEFDASGLAVPDGKLGVVFFLGQPQSAFGSSSYTLEWFDINHFTPINSITITNVIGTPTHLIRWGANGLAFTTANEDGTGSADGAVYLVSGSFSTSDSTPENRPFENVHKHSTTH